MNIPERLKELRERAGLTMAEMAAHMGLAGPSSYQRYEDPQLYRKSSLIADDVAKLFAPLVGKGTPPITEEEIWQLTGIPPAQCSVGPNTATSIGDHLKAARKRKRLTQEQVASAFAVSQASVARWESGIQAPDMVTLLALARFCGVSVDTLLGEAEPFVPALVLRGPDAKIRLDLEVTLVQAAQILAIVARPQPCLCEGSHEAEAAERLLRGTP